MMLLLKKELKLTASPLSFFFVAFAAMTMIPGYPILVGAFFVCFGIFQSFQSGREAGDILYTAMLPVEKADVVRAKYIFTVAIQMIAYVLMVVLTLLRMALLADAAPYVNNALMNANAAYLGYVLLIYATFNLVFLRGFFLTAYKFGAPFFTFAIVAFLVLGLAETLHFLPGCAALNSTRFASSQLIPLAVGVVLYVGVTAISLKKAIVSFEGLDL